MKKRKISEMTRSELESELKVNAKTLKNMVRQNPKPLKEIEQEANHNKDKSEQLQKLFIERQTKHDLFEEKLKFYKSLTERSTKRKRPKSYSFVHSSRSRAQILENFKALAERKQDKRYQVAIWILKNDHIQNTEGFEKLVKESSVNTCILDSIYKRKLIHDNYENIHQLYEVLFSSALPDSDDEKEHAEKIKKLNAKLDKVRAEYMKRVHDKAKIKELKEQIEEIDKDIESSQQRKTEIENEIEKQKKDQIEHEEHTFQVHQQFYEAEMQTLRDSINENKEKLEQIQQFTEGIRNEKQNIDGQLEEARKDFDIINGQFKAIIESYPSDPFDDPNFVALFTNNFPSGNNENDIRISTPDESQLKATELEDQIQIVNYSIQNRKTSISELQKELEKYRKKQKEFRQKQDEEKKRKEAEERAKEEERKKLEEENKKREEEKRKKEEEKKKLLDAIMQKEAEFKTESCASASSSSLKKERESESQDSNTRKHSHHHRHRSQVDDVQRHSKTSELSESNSNRETNTDTDALSSATVQSTHSSSRKGKKTEMPTFVEGAPNAELSKNHMPKKQNEVVIYAGEYDFTTPVVGKHSVKAILTASFQADKVPCETRLSSHHKNFKALFKFSMPNTPDLTNFIKNQKVSISIVAGKDEMKDIGKIEFSLLPFAAGYMKISQNVDIISPNGDKIGTITIESSCRRMLIETL